MTTILRGNIIHTPSFGALETVPGGCLVLEDGILTGIFERLPEWYAACPVEDSSPGTGLKGDARRNRPLFLSSPSMCSFCGGMRGKFWFNRRHICPHWTYHECGIKPTEEGPV